MVQSACQEVSEERKSQSATAKIFRTFDNMTKLPIWSHVASRGPWISRDTQLLKTSCAAQSTDSTRFLSGSDRIGVSGSMGKEDLVQGTKFRQSGQIKSYGRVDRHKGRDDQGDRNELCFSEHRETNHYYGNIFRSASYIDTYNNGSIEL
ncbi:hypothetical protein PHISCL_01964 [Aspergillus sclerotialis]|uniref:Uncharacterized protein n=1 Tax=Aspergillus sclerotialis TaxID=2070753 RepID=A0A3A3A8K7_9EURO|nr:hypothetical protein PHISCL_01964 [Aspergillus sclerotialis]